MHVGIVGHRLSRDSELLALLSRSHRVTTASSHDVVTELAATQSIDVLVLEANRGAPEITHIVAHLRARYPHVTLVLVNGKLTQLDIAEFFRLGVADYFAAPWNDALLAERIDVLAARHRPGSATPTATGDDS